jgi:hypothetical protein
MFSQVSVYSIKRMVFDDMPAMALLSEAYQNAKSPAPIAASSASLSLDDVLQISPTPNLSKHLSPSRKSLPV